MFLSENVDASWTWMKYVEIRGKEDDAVRSSIEMSEKYLCL